MKKAKTMADKQKRDYYEVLGVNKNSTPDEIKSAYRKAALKAADDVIIRGEGIDDLAFAFVAPL